MTRHYYLKRISVQVSDMGHTKYNLLLTNRIIYLNKNMT